MSLREEGELGHSQEGGFSQRERKSAAPTAQRGFWIRLQGGRTQAQNSRVRSLGGIFCVKGGLTGSDRHPFFFLS